MDYEMLIEAARDWLSDCFPEKEPYIYKVRAAEVQRIVERHYDGGWVAFCADAQPVSY